MPETNHEALTSARDRVGNGCYSPEYQTGSDVGSPKITINDTGPPPVIRLAHAKGEFLFLCALCMVAFVWKVLSIKHLLVISADGTSYCQAGRAFFQTGNVGVFGTVFPPLYPFFIGLLDLVTGNLELSARYVSVFFSTATLIPLYYLGKIPYGRIGGGISAALFAVLPMVHAMSAIDIAEPVYTFFMISGALLFWNAIEEWSCSYKKFYGAGILMGLAYLARPESFVTLFALTVSMSGLCAVKNRAKLLPFLVAVAIAWCGFFSMAFPYMVHLHAATGKWQLSGKTSLNVNSIMEYQGQGPSDQRYSLNEKGEFVSQEGTLAGFILKNPQGFLFAVNKNLAAFIPALKEALPVFLWPVALIGFLLPPWRRTNLIYKLFLLMLLSPVLLYLVFYVVNRYLYPYLPMLLIFTAGALLKADDFISSSMKIPKKWFSVTIAVALCGFFMYSEIPAPRPPYHYEQDGGRFDDKQVGLRLKQILPKNSILMSRSGRVTFYAGMGLVIPPQAEPDKIFEFARKNKVTHLVANMQLLGMRPQLEYLFTPLINPGTRFIPPPGLELVYIGQEPGGLPYIIYRFI